MNLRSDCHPEARGRKPQHGDVAWNLRLMLESGEPLQLSVGRKGRDILFGMMIADCHDSQEDEPTPLLLEWIRPPWRDRDEDDVDGSWPWCGDQFLAAVRVVNNKTKKEYWEFSVLTWSEVGLQIDGEEWCAWDESDIEWIARIPEPS